MSTQTSRCRRDVFHRFQQAMNMRHKRRGRQERDYAKGTDFEALFGLEVPPFCRDSKLPGKYGEAAVKIRRAAGPIPMDISGKRMYVTQNGQGVEVGNQYP